MRAGMRVPIACGLSVGGFILSVFWVAAAGSAAPADKAPPAAAFRGNAPVSSRECGNCHKDIYAAWKNSLHSQAVDNPVFWASYLKVHYQDSGLAQSACLACHAPLARLGGDLRLTRDITREGVNCDFCHSISSVRSAAGAHESEQEFGAVKQGPLKDVVSPAHQTRFNALYQDSRICSACHDYTNADGLKLIETFSEWERGPYAREGVHCQNCHMRKVSGKIVREEIKQTPEKEVSSHDIAGGHSPAMREKSLQIDIKNIRVAKQKVEVTVAVTNAGAGHSIPTGLPSKRIVLQASIVSANGASQQTQQRVYQKTVAGGDGNPVSDDAALMSGRGFKITADNRLLPRETREELFTFFVAGFDPASWRVSAAAYYAHDPQIIETNPVRIKIKEVSKLAGP